jgi:hypothetical protein
MAPWLRMRSWAIGRWWRLRPCGTAEGRRGADFLVAFGRGWCAPRPLRLARLVVAAASGLSGRDG